MAVAFTILVAILVLAGIILLALGFRGRRVSDAPHCRCGFELSGITLPESHGPGSASAVCPECGKALAAKGQIREGRRARRPALIGIGAAMLALGLAVPITLVATGPGKWYAYAPDWLLVKLLDADDSPGPAVATEIAARAGAGTFSASSWTALERALLSRQADLSRSWSPALGKLLEDRALRPDSPKELRETYLRNTLRFKFAVRQRIAIGDPLPMTLELIDRTAGSGRVTIRGYLAEVRLNERRIDGDRIRFSATPRPMIETKSIWPLHPAMCTTGLDYDQYLVDGEPGPASVGITIFAAAAISDSPSSGISERRSPPNRDPPQRDPAQLESDLIEFAALGRTDNQTLGKKHRGPPQPSRPETKARIEQAVFAISTLEFSAGTTIVPAAESPSIGTRITDPKELARLTPSVSIMLYRAAHTIGGVTTQNVLASLFWSSASEPHARLAGDLFLVRGDDRIPIATHYIETGLYNNRSTTGLSNQEIQLTPEELADKTDRTLTFVLVPSPRARTALMDPTRVIDAEIWFNDVPLPWGAINNQLPTRGELSRKDNSPPPASEPPQTPKP